MEVTLWGHGGAQGAPRALQARSGSSGQGWGAEQGIGVPGGIMELWGRQGLEEGFGDSGVASAAPSRCHPPQIPPHVSPEPFPLFSSPFQRFGFPVANPPFSLSSWRVGKKQNPWKDVRVAALGWAGRTEPGAESQIPDPKSHPSLLGQCQTPPRTAPHPNPPHLSNTCRIPGALNPTAEPPSAPLAHKAGPLFCYLHALIYV